MSKETIVASIDKNGNIELSVEGIKGKSCVDATADLEVYLGAVGEKEYTADYYKKKDPEKKVWITGR